MQEVIEVSRWLPVDYFVEVVNFSGEAPIDAAAPVVTVTVAGRSQRKHDRSRPCSSPRFTAARSP